LVPTPSVSVVIVSYDSEGLREAVTSVPSWAGVVVVEQHPLSRRLNGIEAVRGDALLIRGGANRGFGAGCNLGAANASGDVLAFLNPDAMIDTDSLALLAHAAREPGAGLVGPSIRDSDGLAATRARNWSSPMGDALHLFLPYSLVPKRWNRQLSVGDPRLAHGGVVAYVQGACMAIERQTFFAAGGFDERFFLYGEEEDLARRLDKIGRSSRLVPDAVAVHQGATSTSKLEAFAVRQLFRSQILLHREHGGVAAMSGAAGLTSAVLAFLMLTAPVRMRVGWRKRETFAWCSQGLCGIHDGLLGRRVRAPAPQETGMEMWPTPGG
jgi:N-acetylglucosaminyl-diphospho-decaprenol L-rhamnosyltransferase